MKAFWIGIGKMHKETILNQTKNANNHIKCTNFQKTQINKHKTLEKNIK